MFKRRLLIIVFGFMTIAISCSRKEQLEEVPSFLHGKFYEISDRIIYDNYPANIIEISNNTFITYWTDYDNTRNEWIKKDYDLKYIVSITSDGDEFVFKLSPDKTKEETAYMTTYIIAYYSEERTIYLSELIGYDGPNDEPSFIQHGEYVSNNYQHLED